MFIFQNLTIVFVNLIKIKIKIYSKKKKKDQNFPMGKAIVEQRLALEEIKKSKRAGL